MKPYRLNIFNKTGAYITKIIGDSQIQILFEAGEKYPHYRWEWDGVNNLPRKD